MSIYPVHIKSFHENTESEDHLEMIPMMIENESCACGVKLTVDNLWADHSLTWGHYRELTCSEICAYDIPQRLLDPDPKVRERAKLHMEEINEENRLQDT